MLATGEYAPAVITPGSGVDLSQHVGRPVVLVFVGSMAAPTSARLLAGLMRSDLKSAAVFVISVDGRDATSAQRWGDDRNAMTLVVEDERWLISRMHGAVGRDAEGRTVCTQFSVVLDRRQRVWASVGVDEAAPEAHGKAVEAALGRLPAEENFPAPVVLVPRVFEPEFCAELVRLFDRDGGQPGLVAVERDGRTVLEHVPGNKARRDLMIEDPSLWGEIATRIGARLAPEVERCFGFWATRMERCQIGCYEVGRGHFRPHIDNNQMGTAHRRFAVSLALNEDYDGGELRFAQFGAQGYRPPLGGAAVFSCSLVHEVTPVTRGRRYMFIPFLFDEEASRQLRTVGSGGGIRLPTYR
jgi:predicted 2-oxoglutarate/Fe(II)-dependent dioxygenase YbiX/peroxiredoxin